MTEPQIWREQTLADAANAARAERDQMRAALEALFRDVEKVAINSHTTWIAPEWVFNDAAWADGDPEGFAVAAFARDALGLPALDLRATNPDDIQR